MKRTNDGCGFEPDTPAPTSEGKTILQFFTVHHGGDPVLKRNLAIKRFKITDIQYDHWLDVWHVGCEEARQAEDAAGWDSTP